MGHPNGSGRVDVYPNGAIAHIGFRDPSELRSERDHTGLNDISFWTD